jgi:hypothetical protein
MDAFYSRSITASRRGRVQERVLLAEECGLPQVIRNQLRAWKIENVPSIASFLDFISAVEPIDKLAHLIQ